MLARLCHPSQVQLFKDSEFAAKLRALPFSEIKTGAEIVYRIPYTTEDGCLVDAYWYGQVGLMRKKGTKHWIKFLDLEDNEKISEELHPLELAGYYDEWFFVERV